MLRSEKGKEAAWPPFHVHQPTVFSRNVPDYNTDRPEKNLDQKTTIYLK